MTPLPPKCPHYDLVVRTIRVCQHCRKRRPATDVVFVDGLFVCDDAHSEACFAAAQDPSPRQRRRVRRGILAV